MYLYLLKFNCYCTYYCFFIVFVGMLYTVFEYYNNFYFKKNFTSMIFFFFLILSFFLLIKTAFLSVSRNSVDADSCFLYGYVDVYGSLLSLLSCLACMVGMSTVNNRIWYIGQMRFCMLVFVGLTLLITNTTNILILYIGFELLFLPTLLIIFNATTTSTTIDSLKKLVIWTLGGIFLILSVFGYLYAQYGTLIFTAEGSQSLTTQELDIFGFLLFIGFGVKIPIVPLHLWLLKIHVDVPAGLSMFLSGFVVKIGLYCWYVIHRFFIGNNIDIYLIGWSMVSICAASIGLYILQDLKRLVAWITIQEMGLMLFLFFSKGLGHVQIVFFFIFFHGIMSIYMFYLVDLIETRVKSREVSLVSGLSLISPQLAKYLWYILLIFSSFPFGFKFIVEIDLIGTIIGMDSVLLVYFILFISLVAVLSVCKSLLSSLYGAPRTIAAYSDLSSREKSLLGFLIFFLLIVALPYYFVV